ncbi:RNI-like protein [Aaosphaeria arxii CBS 175.79]|uniref:RNI-like protein n=1 Tax=Aaosphaeria arxii CBS 175.79 TaxID=1450172 RepID=A0A6A5XB04_9PLEO|nr:RNI-like protein [Aaosphaeria arxii CBS 175.79]KAF2010158.1 RNI-like protein [Aaosphaeria arxii CBS 175.79]
MDAPRRKAADPVSAAIAEKAAELLYPAPDHSLAPIIKYERDLVKLRRHVVEQRVRAIDTATKENEQYSWRHRIIEQGPWDPLKDPVSLDGSPSLPMPVQISEPKTLKPFFDHLRVGGTEKQASSTTATESSSRIQEPHYEVDALEFERGVVYSDRRMDLCKMVLGPTNIKDLLESLKSNEFITHFLLGNNIIGPYGAKCIAEFLQEYPDRIDTWYLAGNCIDGTSFKVLVDQLVKSSTVTNIWLKRNPLGPSSADDLFRLITETPNLRTLDLDQTELGDVGVTNLFSKLAAWEQPLPLRHIYLNAVGIGLSGATAIRNFLASPHCRLESLYASSNPLGSPGVEALAVGLAANKSLTRLSLTSVGLTDDGTITLCESLYDHPTLMTLQLGHTYATRDLDARFNWITDKSAPAIQTLISRSQIAYLNLSFSALTQVGLNQILSAVASSPSIQYFFGKTIWPQSREAEAIAEGQKHAAMAKQAHDHIVANIKRIYGADYDYHTFHAEDKRWLLSDKTDVRKIDSVYRNRDAGLARRHIKKLDKWWDADDETLAQVMKATGPVCTMRKH